VFTRIHPVYSSVSNMMSVSCVAAILLFSIFIKKITCMILKYLPLYILRLYIELFYCCSSLINSHCHHVGIDDDRVYKEFQLELKVEVRFEVSAVVTKKITVFWDLKQYLPTHCQYLE
jgi:hypothetical protein